MPLHLTKWERRDGADRDAFGRAALAYCRAARSTDGVRDARFYWASADTIGVVVNAEVGSFGINSGRDPSAESAKALFSLSDHARPVWDETWGEAGAGERTYRISQ